jgi:hypothetical protein
MLNYDNESAMEITEQHKTWLAYQRLLNGLGDKQATKTDLIMAMTDAVHYLEEVII